MPRKPKAPARTEPGFRSVPVANARPLVTLGPDHPCWAGIPFGVDGAIVWVVPPESATDEEVAKVVHNAETSGAVKVKVERRRKSRVVLDAKERRPHLRARDVVLEIARAANVPDRDALVAFCERVMAGVSL